MNFLQATVSKTQKPWIDDQRLKIVFDVGEHHEITGVTCTIKETGKEKTFKPVGKGEDALVRMFMQMEIFIGKITPPNEIQKREQKSKKVKVHKVEKRIQKRIKKR